MSGTASLKSPIREKMRIWPRVEYVKRIFFLVNKVIHEAHSSYKSQRRPRRSTDGLNWISTLCMVLRELGLQTRSCRRPSLASCRQAIRYGPIRVSHVRLYCPLFRKLIYEYDTRTFSRLHSTRGCHCHPFFISVSFYSFFKKTFLLVRIKNAT
jgi:hypothetical protein